MPCLFRLYMYDYREKKNHPAGGEELQEIDRYMITLLCFLVECGN